MIVQGRELCESFFKTVNLPANEEDLTEFLFDITVEMVVGLQCYGNDDENVRDHSWGHGFGIWLGSDSYRRFAGDLQLVLDRLPREY